MKIMFLQELTGGLFGGLLNGLLNRRFKGLFARTPTVAVLLLTAVVAACASSSDSNSSGPTTTTPPTLTPADCVFAEGAAAAVDGYTGCELFALPQVFDSETTYNITVVEVGEETTDKLGVSNFTFTQIINGSVSGTGRVNSDQLILAANVDALNITIIGIADNVFGEFYIELVKSDDATVKVRYTISITPMNDDPVFSAVSGSESQFNEADDATPANYRFADIPFNSTAGYSVGNVSASDIDGDTIEYSIIGGTDDTDLFQISSTGEITLKKVAVNSEDSAITYTFNVTASDDQGGSARIVIAVSVLPFFRADCIFAEDEGTIDCGLLALPQVFNSNTTYNITFGEVNKGNTSKIGPGNFNFTQIIQGDTLNHPVVNFNQTQKQLTLSENATAVNITIIDITPNLFGEFYIELVLVDNDEVAVKALYTISITPVNDDPVFTAPPGNFADIPFNSPAGYSVGNVSASDIDGDTVRYSIIGGTDDTDLFQINPTTGEITLKEVAVNPDDSPITYTFNITASDGKGGSARIEITVSVLPDIDITPPVFTRTPYNFDLSLSAATAADVLVYNVEAEVAEGTNFVYSLAGGSDLFKLADDENTDGSINIFLSRAATLSDFAASSIIFQVVATHQGDGLLSEEDITVNLINDLQLSDDFDMDGVKGLYDASPHDDTTDVTGNGDPGDPYIINNIYQLQAIAGVDHEGTPLGSSDFTNNSFLYGTNAAEQLTKHYKLANDINASDTADTTVWAKPAVTTYVGHGWTPIAGKDGESFSGSFNGEGYAINSLEIIARQGDNSKNFGLFGINNGNITALGLQDINMKIQAPGDDYIGITRVDNIISGSHAGGLVALNQEDGVISYSYATGLVNASMDSIGGLIGLNQGEISYSYSTATVQGAGDTGGLVGTNEGGALLSSYATGDVRGSYGIQRRTGTAGGLAGSISGAGAIIDTSYAIGMLSDVTPDRGFSLGGVVAERDDDIQGRVNVTIISSYWDNGTTNSLMGVGMDRNFARNPGDQTGTAPLTTAQLQGCGLNGEVISSAPPAPDCTGLFPSSHWGNDPITTTDGATIARGWSFNAEQYPSLRVIRSPGDRPLLPDSAEQQCQRNGMPFGCE